ncbi:hypothetical protein DFJ73DRAFT_35896 [Zopfochytrium polystomum]|nr:hypothetical protein DFJ73DRAFT_35896 [Zopfochytrium polystomum]
MQKGVFPVAGRDLVTLVKVHYDDGFNGPVYAVATSLPDYNHPQDPKRVRAHLETGTWVLEPMNGGIAVSYFVLVDVKGTVPPSLIKVVQTQTPMCIAEVASFITKEGAFPLLIRHIATFEPAFNILQVSEEYDPKSGNFTSNFTVHNPGTLGGSISYLFPPKRFPGGNIEVSVKAADASSSGGIGAIRIRRVVGTAVPLVGQGTAVTISVDTAAVPAGLDKFSVVVLFRRSTAAGVTYNGRTVEDTRVDADDKPMNQVVAPVTVIAPTPTSREVPIRTTEPSTPVATAPQPRPAALPSVAATPVAPAAPAKRPYIEHQYSALGRKALDFAKQIYPLDSAGWIPHSVNGNVKITQKDVPGFPMAAIRGDSFWNGFTMLEALSVLKNLESRSVWDARYDGGKILDTLNLDENVVYTLQKGTFPVAGRELVVLLKVHFENGLNGPLYAVASSIPDHSHPSDPKRVRAHLETGTWVLEPKDGGIAVSYFVLIDVKGSVPASVLKLVQSQTPMCVAEVGNYLANEGPFPFLIRHVANFEPSFNITDFSQDYDPKSGSFNARFTVNNAGSLGGSLTYLFPSKRFPGGRVAVAVQCAVAEAIRVRRAVGSAVSLAGVGTAITVSIDAASAPAGIDKIAVVATFSKSAVPGVTYKGSVVEDTIVDAGDSLAQLPVIQTSAPPKTPPSKAGPASPTTAAPKPPTYVPHRHTETGVKALRHLKALLAKKWTKHPETKGGLSVSSVEVEGFAATAVKAEKVFPPEFSTEDIVAAIRSGGARLYWDEGFDGVQVVEFMNPNEYIFRTKRKPSPPYK